MTVADIDTGADFQHQDLQGKLVAGAAFLNGNGQPSGSNVNDGFGHGTMTTGIMVASTDNGLGMASVAPDARALIVKVLNDQGQGYDNDIAGGIDYAVAHGASVINLSLGPDLPVPQSAGTSAIPDAIRRADNAGVAVAIAAGNTGIDVSPQALTALNGYALVVGATGRDGNIASYSNSSVGVNIYAPGGDTPPGGSETVQNAVVSTYYHGSNGNASDGYAYGDGTSFATPEVAGVMALLRQLHPSWSPAQIYSRITSTARGSNPDLDAAAAVGVDDGFGCASNSVSVPAAHPGGAGPTASPPRTSGTAQPGTSPPAAGTPSPAVSTPDVAGGVRGSTLTPVNGTTGSTTAAPASLPLAIGIPAVLLILGAPVGTAFVRRRLRPPS